MNFTKTDIEGLIIIETKKYVDDRGYFFKRHHLLKENWYVFPMVK